MANIFDSIRVNKAKSTLFNLSHEVKLTTDIGVLTPIMCHPYLPGDKFKYNAEVFTRFAPMLAPIMHRVNMYVHSFCIPVRILYKDYESFFTGGISGTEKPVYPRLHITYDVVQQALNEPINLFGPGSVWDFLGFPILQGSDGKVYVSPSFEVYVDALPFLAYYKVWQYYYADENLSDFPFDEDTKLNSGIISGPQAFQYLMNCQLRFRCYEKDYFTSALPTPQRGNDVRIPLSDVELSGKLGFDNTNRTYATLLNGGQLPQNSPIGTGSTFSIANGNNVVVNPTGDVKALALDVTGNLDVKGIKGTANAATINELRRAFAAQAWQETSMRGGWRYPEQILSHFGVKSKDARAQWPTYLGGGKAPVMIGEVLQTSESTTESPLGDMAGKAVSTARSNSFTKYFTEHGYIITILSVIPRTQYQGGLSRLFTKFDRYDYAWPEFAHLGEQEVLNQEVNLNLKDPSKNEKTFGYQSRYAEYKYIPSSTHGDFLTNMAFWHLGRKFPMDNNPGLNEDFVTCRPEDNSRIFAVDEQAGSDFLNPNHLWIQVYNNVKAIRKLPRYGTPRL